MSELRHIDQTTAGQPGDPRAASGQLSVVRTAELAVVPSARGQVRRHARNVLVFLLVAAIAGALGTYWWIDREPSLPAGIAYGNGRLEVDPIDIDTKFAGRVLELRVEEGDMVKAGQVLAVMDTRNLEASLRRARAQVEQANRAIIEANANVSQLRTQVVLAQQQMERAETLLKNGWITRELFDQRRQQLEAAQAGELAASARVRVAEAARNAAQHDVELYTVNIADNTLVAPRDGRIEYRVANVGEVLPAGGKVFTLLDIGYVYMDIYLPTATAGRVRIGDEARIVLDAYPERPIQAKVSFIASQAQFTPKMVETRTEREKLMFRVRVRIDPDRTRAHAETVHSGIPGMAYVKFDAQIEWPGRLQGAP
jgi:HlyD family secretion protein